MCSKNGQSVVNADDALSILNADAETEIFSIADGKIIDVTDVFTRETVEQFPYRPTVIPDDIGYIIKLKCIYIGIQTTIIHTTIFFLQI